MRKLYLISVFAGIISWASLSFAMPMMGHHGDKMMELDTDKDGKVSKQEYIAHHQKMFEKMDADQDGYLDKTECQMMREKMMEKMKSGKKGKMGRMKQGQKSMPKEDQK